MANAETDAHEATSPSEEATGALTGVTVLDLTQLAQGPFATQILGDLGADILKVEPLRGDWMRGFALSNRYLDGESVSFLSFNRNKRSIALSLKHPDGVAVFRRLLEGVDVLVENFRPGVMDRLGFGYESAAEINSRLIYCSSSGYGADGPYRTRPGQDLLIQALAGLPWLNGRAGDPPVPVGLGIADLTAGLHIVYGILAALLQRARTGRGQQVSVSLLNSLLALETQELTAHMNGAPLPERHGHAMSSPYVGPPFAIYATTDGYLAVAMNPLDKLVPLLDIELDDLPDSMNAVEDADRLYRELSAAFARRATQEWLDVLLPADIWCAPVQDYDQVVADPQVVHNRMIRQVDHPTAGRLSVVGPAVEFSDAASTIRRPPPRLGEHTGAVLAERLGIAADELARLVAVGAVADGR